MKNNRQYGMPHEVAASFFYAQGRTDVKYAQIFEKLFSITVYCSFLHSMIRYFHLKICLTADNW